MKIASVNFYVFNKSPVRDLNRLERMGIDSIGFQEANRHFELIEKELDRYKVVKARRSNGYGAREVAVAIHERNEYLGHQGREVSDLDDGNETKIFKSRWITVVRFRGADGYRYCHINYHGNAVVQSKRTGKLLRNLERTKEWLDAAREINRTVKNMQERGYRIIVTGDFNYRRIKRLENFKLDFWSPQRIFKRRKLDYFERGLDYVAWSRPLKKKRVTIIDAGTTGSDHPWIVVELV